MNSFDYWGIILLPLLIFFARITDVSIGTIRIILVSKGQRVWAPILGFFEILIWIIVMSKIIQNLDRWYYYVFYAAGFAVGNFVGIWLEDKLAVGYAALRLITNKQASPLIQALKEEGYGLTYLDASGSKGPVHIIYTIVKRKKLPQLIHKIHEFNPMAFYTLEDVKSIGEGISRISHYKKNVLFRRGRKGK